jgi:ABC-type dipeptide/oligopeptide/nickel transport system ATPase subunit
VGFGKKSVSKLSMTLALNYMKALGLVGESGCGKSTLEMLFCFWIKRLQDKFYIVVKTSPVE